MSSHYIDTPAELTAFCQRAAEESWLALDTEFVREKSYYARLCLVQIGTSKENVCIDPLALDDLQPLFDLLHNPAITKVLHAARQDLEIFMDLTGKIPQPVFDTQMAATLVGLGDQVGYGPLVEKLLDVRLEKTHSRTDWSYRPLDDGQINYALDDVVYLRKMYPLLLDKLESMGRLDWLQADFDWLTNPETYVMPLDLAWTRLRGTNRLKPPQLAVLRELASWREDTARNRDKPRKWIMRDDVLVEIAKHKPATIDKLRRIRGLDERTLERMGKRILGMVRTALDSPKDSWPQPAEMTQRLTPNQDAQTDALMCLLRLSAAANEISAASLASRKELEKLVIGERDLPVLQGWRAKLAGDTLLEFLEGRCQLVMDGGELMLQQP